VELLFRSIEVMDKIIQKRLNELGVSNKEFVEEKRVETHISKMTPVEMLRALKERYIDRKDEISGGSDCNPIVQLDIRIETVEQCINLISNNKERNDMLGSIKYLLQFVRDWEKEVPRGLPPMSYLTGDYKADVEIKKKIDTIKDKWEEELNKIEEEQWDTEK